MGVATEIRQMDGHKAQHPTGRVVRRRRGCKRGAVHSPERLASAHYEIRSLGGTESSGCAPTRLPNAIECAGLCRVLRGCCQRLLPEEGPKFLPQAPN